MQNANIAALKLRLRETENIRFVRQRRAQEMQHAQNIAFRQNPTVGTQPTAPPPPLPPSAPPLKPGAHFFMTFLRKRMLTMIKPYLEASKLREHRVSMRHRPHGFLGLGIDRSQIGFKS